MSSLPRQRGLTELQPKQTKDRPITINVTPRVATIAHTTEQKFLIGSFASSQPNFYKVQPFHICIDQASHVSHMSLPIYNIRATAQQEK